MFFGDCRKQPLITHTIQRNKILVCLFVCYACLLARSLVEELEAQSHYIPAGVFRIFFFVVILWRIIFNLLCALDEIHFLKILQEIGRWVCCWKKKKKPKPCLHEKLFLFFLSVFVFIFRWFLVVDNIPSEQHVLCLEVYRLSWFFLCCHLLLLPAFHAFSCVHSVDKSCSS